MTHNASPLVKALEDAWVELQSRHPEIPDVVIVLGSGATGGVLEHWGTWTEGAWNAEGKATGEFKLAGEAATEGAVKVLEVLVHEAAHALNSARLKKDTSRQGRYHNLNYAEAAMELGLSVEKDVTYGWAITTYTPIEKDRKILRSIEEALKIERPYDSILETEDEEERPPTSVPTECACPRKLRLKLTTQEEGPVICGVCKEEFLPTQ